MAYFGGEGEEEGGTVVDEVVRRSFLAFVFPFLWLTSSPSSFTFSGAAALTRRSIHSSSLISTSTSPLHQSIIVLPDFKIITEVQPTREDAEEVVMRYLAPSVGRAGGDTEVGLGDGRMKSWCVDFLDLLDSIDFLFPSLDESSPQRLQPSAY